MVPLEWAMSTMEQEEVWRNDSTINKLTTINLTLQKVYKQNWSMCSNWESKL